MTNEPVALVTGANGGFGTRVMRRLLSEGWRVVAVVRGGAERLPLHPDLENALQEGRLSVRDVDMIAYANRGEPESLVEGRLDALVCIAGSSVFGSVADIPLPEYRMLHTLNVEAPYLLVQAHLPQLVKQKGVIVQTSSLSAASPLPYYGVYASTKLAMEGWSEALAHEVAPLGVRVHCVRPGAFRTGVQHRMRFVAPERLPALLSSFAMFRTFIQEAAHSTAGDPNLFADKVVSLVTTRSSSFRTSLGPGARLVDLASWIPERLRMPLFRWVLWKQIRRNESRGARSVQQLSSST